MSHISILYGKTSIETSFEGYTNPTGHHKKGLISLAKTYESVTNWNFEITSNTWNLFFLRCHIQYLHIIMIIWKSIHSNLLWRTYKSHWKSSKRVDFIGKKYESVTNWNQSNHTHHPGFFKWLVKTQQFQMLHKWCTKISNPIWRMYKSHWTFNGLLSLATKRIC